MTAYLQTCNTCCGVQRECWRGYSRPGWWPVGLFLSAEIWHPVHSNRSTWHLWTKKTAKNTKSWAIENDIITISW